MSKSMLMGLVAGIGVATAGGVLGYQFLGQQGAEVASETEAPADAAPAPRTAVSAAPAQECWDEEVQVTAAPKDEHRIAGTAIGAVVGGAIGKDVGDDSDLATAAGAAAGAFIGRKAQEEFQETRADERTTTTIERRCGPAGGAPR